MLRVIARGTCNSRYDGVNSVQSGGDLTLRGKDAMTQTNHPTCDRVTGRVGQPSKRCGRKARVVSNRSIFIPEGPFVGQSPMRLHYCGKHEKFAHVTDYSCVRVESVARV